MVQIGDGYIGPGAIEQPKPTREAPSHNCREHETEERLPDSGSEGKTGLARHSCGMCGRPLGEMRWRTEEPAETPSSGIASIVTEDGKFKGVLMRDGKFRDAKTVLDSKKKLL